MFLTQSYENDSVMPPEIRAKYWFLETGSAAAVMSVVSPTEWEDILSALDEFHLNPQTWLKAGGNRGDVAKELDGLFEKRGWAERRLDLEVKGFLLNRKKEKVKEFVTQYQEGYLVDNFKGRIAVDVEWNAKDGNLDRDMTAYRTWYEAGVLTAGVIITKELEEQRVLYKELEKEWNDSAPEDQRITKPLIDLGTTTTTNFAKATLRIQRAVQGTCPLLVVGVGRNAWNRQPYLGPNVS
ncbi:MAG: BglII/BstYI family type II restriction endonuclease [Actinomycetaceae bacterium]|nr:BglII/BstYI family type II restriction endonuclease [Actinomycetaceae bacterium]